MLVVLVHDVGKLREILRCQHQEMALLQGFGLQTTVIREGSHVGSEGRRGRWGTPTMALHV